MIWTVIVAAIIALLAGFLGTLIALKIHYRYLQRIQAQRRAWEHAQESGQHNWEIKQEKRALEMNARLNGRIQQVENEWNAWKQKNAELVQTVTQQHAEIATFLHIERELARIPLVEEMPIAFDGKGQRLPTSSRWHPLSLAHVDLSERDLSRRYLGQANLCEARLRGTNFFMADLSGADLSGADLTGADLTGANLSHADLHNAILLNANLQVADLHNTILFGADLHGARNLNRKQLDTAIYDASSQLDTDFDFTIPRLPIVKPTTLTPTSSISTPSIHPARSVLSSRLTGANIPVVKAKQQTTAGKAAPIPSYMEAEIPDLDVSPTPVTSKETPPSPAPSSADEIIEGEITGISEAASIEGEAITGISLDEPTDAEIREINDTESHESGQAEETLAIPEFPEFSTPEEEPIVAESRLFIVESEFPASSDEPTGPESEAAHEKPSPAADSFDTEAPVESSPVEPEFVPLAIEPSTNGNGYRNGSGNSNGQKRGASTGATLQKGKNNNRKRSRTR